MGLKRLDTGQTSVPGSGDTIHDGGNKLHDNFDELYSQFSDKRLDRVIKNGTEEWITPHATGYFQHYPLSYYASAIRAGSMHDIDSSVSSGFFPVILPAIGNAAGTARRGEKIMIQDSSASWGALLVRVTPNAGQSITGADATGNYILNQSDTLATFTVVDDSPGNERWSVKIQSIAGNDGAEVDGSVEIPFGVVAKVDLHDKTNYNTIKVLCYAESMTISDQTVTKRTCFELHIMNTPTDVLSAKYSVLNTVAGDTIIEATPISYLGSNGRDSIAINFTSNEPATQQVTVTVKSVGSLKQKL